jgi:hypothetical protein
MDSGAWKLVSSAFQEALDLPAGERRVFLEALDPAVREEVLALLASYEPSAALEPQPPPAGSGQTFGPYLTLELIGQGGMGAVFRVARRDGEFSQEAALKIIGGRAFDKAAEERFRTERQILARLQHPNIVRFLDGGIERGKRYFVMELLRGERITEYCRAVAARKDHREAVPSGVRCDSLRAPEPGDSPRLETVEHSRDRRRDCESTRFRRREDPPAGPRAWEIGHERAGGLARLRESGTGAG